MGQRLDAFKSFYADLARPSAIYMTFGSSAIATVRLAWTGGDLNSAAIFIGAVLAGGSAIYVGRAFENKWAARASADVDIAKVKADESARASSTTVVQHADRVDAAGPTSIEGDGLDGRPVAGRADDDFPDDPPVIRADGLGQEAEPRR